MTKPVVRLHLFFASENNKAVILRQAPSKQFRMILWHRDTDMFEDGQWIKSKIFVERCSLSPDGAHFLYFALDGRWSSDAKGAFTAISIPPYWTAVSLFPQGDTWGGGGMFLDSKHFYADGGKDTVGRLNHVHRVVFGQPDKGCTTGLRLESGARAPLERAVTKALLSKGAPESRWDLDNKLRGRTQHLVDQYDTLGGKLYRRQGHELSLIRDFTDMKFETIRAPYDWREKREGMDSSMWHPLDGDEL